MPPKTFYFTLEMEKKFQQDHFGIALALHGAFISFVSLIHSITSPQGRRDKKSAGPHSRNGLARTRSASCHTESHVHL